MHNIQEEYAVVGKFIRKTITSFETQFAIRDGADAYSIIDVQVPQPPTDIKKFLEGDEDLTLYPVASSVSKLCNYALASFPNIETIYLFKNDGLMTLSENTFGGLDNLENVFVPESLYSAYQEAYPEFAELFKKLVTTYVWDVPLSGSSELSIFAMTGFIGMLSNGEKGAIGKIVFPEEYETFELGCLDDIFSGNTFNSLEYIEFESGTAFLCNAYSTEQNGSILEVE